VGVNLPKKGQQSNVAVSTQNTAFNKEMAKISSGGGHGTHDHYLSPHVNQHTDLFSHLAMMHESCQINN